MNSNISGIAHKTVFLTISIAFCLVAFSFAQEPDAKKVPVVKTASMVDQFYTINHEPLYWFSSKKSIKKAAEWLSVLESAKRFGLVSDQQQIEQIRSVMANSGNKDKVLKEKTDKQLTDLILNFIKVLQEGIVSFEYSEVNTPRDSVYIYQLMNARYKGSVSKIVSRLDCKNPDYLIYKKFLNDSVAASDSLKYKTLVRAMNYCRYLEVNGQAEYIVANIPATEVDYFRENKPVLKMKSVVGRKKNPTPTIASYITNIVTFPFWNVPFSIASKELLPKVQKNESYLERNNFDVVDSKGNIVDDSEINWDSYTEKNFPYFFRESTGPNNALGVLKFNLQNPYSIYLHDTNSKGAFAKADRFLSHGCIRLEKPVELADLLTRGKIDVYALKSGKKDTESKIIKLDQKIPVFIIYSPVTISGGKVVFLKDVYGLIK